jgi:hypothetical protein
VGFDRAQHDRLVMSETVAKWHEVGHQRGDLGAITRTGGKRAVQMRNPEPVVALVKQSAPEPKRQPGDHAPARRLLAVTRDPRDRFNNTLARLLAKHGRVLKRRVPGGVSGVDWRELRIDSVAQQHLDMVQRLEHRRRDPRIPDVQRHRGLVVAASGCEVRREPCVGEPGCRLGRLHNTLNEQQYGATLVGVCPR